MTDDIGIALEYEKILMGKQKIFSRAYNHEGIAEEKILPIFKYVFRDLLRWDAYTIKNYVNMEVLNILKLGKLAKRLKIPQEITIEKDTFYLAHKIYPDQIDFSKRTLVIYSYEKVLQRKRLKYPRNFFDATQGNINARLCLQYAISKQNFQNIWQLYNYFKDGKEIRNFLKKVHLYEYFNSVYEYPVDYLHDSLSDHDKSDLFYHFIHLRDELKYMKTGEVFDFEDNDKK